MKATPKTRLTKQDQAQAIANDLRHRAKIVRSFKLVQTADALERMAEQVVMLVEDE